jgi:hypothetical protein
MKLQFTFLFAFLTSYSSAIHIAKVDSGGYLNAVKSVKYNKSYYRIGEKPFCFKYRNNEKQKGKFSEFDICKKGYQSKSRSIKSAPNLKPNSIPLNIILPGCHYQLHEISELNQSDVKRNFPSVVEKNLVYRRLLRIEKMGVIAYMSLSGKVDRSVLKLPLGKIKNRFILKKDNKTIINYEGICCDPKKNRNGCEFYREECLNKMNRFNYSIFDKEKNEILLIDMPSGVEGYHFRISKLTNSGLQEVYKDSIYGVGSCFR